MRFSSTAVPIWSRHLANSRLQSANSPRQGWDACGISPEKPRLEQVHSLPDARRRSHGTARLLKCTLIPSCGFPPCSPTLVTTLCKRGTQDVNDLKSKKKDRNNPVSGAGLKGFEPLKWRSQSPLPYHLAIALNDAFSKRFVLYTKLFKASSSIYCVFIRTVWSAASAEKISAFP